MSFNGLRLQSWIFHYLSSITLSPLVYAGQTSTSLIHLLIHSFIHSVTMPWIPKSPLLHISTWSIFTYIYLCVCLSRILAPASSHGWNQYSEFYDYSFAFKSLITFCLILLIFEAYKKSTIFSEVIWDLFLSNVILNDIHIVGGCRSLNLTAVWESSVWLDHMLFIHFFEEGHLDYFQSVTTKNVTSLNIFMCVSYCS